MSTQELLTIKELAQALDVGESTVRFWRDRYEAWIPSTGEGKRRKYRKQALDVLRFVKDMANRSENAEGIKEALSREFPTNIEPTIGSQRSNAATQQLPELAHFLPALAHGQAALVPVLERMAGAFEALAQVQAENREIRAENTALAERMARLEARVVQMAGAKSRAKGTAGQKVEPLDRAEVVRRVKEMLGQGLSCGQIAAQLNAEGVKTFSGYGSWARGTVYNLAKKEGLT